MPPKDEIIHNRKQNHDSVYQRTPIHTHRLNRRRQRKEREAIHQQKEENGDDVTRQARSPETPSRARKGLSTYFAQCHAGDRDDVGAQDGADGERDDGVEGYAAA